MCTPLLKFRLGFLIAVCCSSCCGLPAHGQEIELLNPSSFLLVQVETQDVDIAPVVSSAAEKSAIVSAWMDQAKAYLAQVKQAAGGERVHFVADLPFRMQLAARMGIAAGPKQDQKLEALASMLWPGSSGTAMQSGDLSVLPLSDTEAGLGVESEASEIADSQRTLWTQALIAAGDRPLKVVLVQPEYFRDTLSELTPKDADVRSDWLAMIGGIRWISIGADPRTLAGDLTLQATDADTAQQIAASLPEWGAKLLDRLPEGGEPIAVADLLEQVDVTLSGAQVVLSWNETQVEALLTTVMQTSEAVAQPLAMQQSISKMKQMVLGIHNYYSAFSCFPTYLDNEKKGRSKLSWRVHILPFIEEHELYQEFHLDESWDSPHNIKLLEKMPAVFKSVQELGVKQEPKPGYTVYATPVGMNTVFGQAKAVDFKNVIDGTSNTAVIVELAVEHAIPWTSPEEYAYDVENPAAKLRDRGGATSIGMLDGSCRGVRLPQSDKMWNALFNIKDGQVVELQ